MRSISFGIAVAAVLCGCSGSSDAGGGNSGDATGTGTTAGGGPAGGNGNATVNLGGTDASCKPDTTVHMGDGTYYVEANGGGNCSFDPTPNDLMVGAMNHTDY